MMTMCVYVGLHVSFDSLHLFYIQIHFKNLHPPTLTAYVSGTGDPYLYNSQGHLARSAPLPQTRITSPGSVFTFKSVKLSDWEALSLPELRPEC